jgi:hypothetical protein
MKKTIKVVSASIILFISASVSLAAYADDKGCKKEDYICRIGL